MNAHEPPVLGCAFCSSEEQVVGERYSRLAGCTTSSVRKSETRCPRTLTARELNEIVSYQLPMRSVSYINEARRFVDPIDADPMQQPCRFERQDKCVPGLKLSALNLCVGDVAL